ncbi:hypothetical protein ACGLDU_004371 [Escherichia coli]
MTRVCTVAARARYPDMRGVLPVGRVQTPTLALVVNHWLAVKNHQETWYFTAATDTAGSAASHGPSARHRWPDHAGHHTVPARQLKSYHLQPQRLPVPF